MTILAALPNVFLLIISFNISPIEEFHGTGGPITVSFPNHQTDISKAWLAAGQEMGFGVVDYNGENQTGTSERSFLRGLSIKWFQISSHLSISFYDLQLPGIRIPLVILICILESQLNTFICTVRHWGASYELSLLNI